VKDMSEKFSFNKPNVSDEEIIEYLNTRENIITVSFISSYSGIPHMCPVWGYFSPSHGSFFFQTEDYVSKTKSIEKGNDKIGVSIVDPHQFPDYKAGSIPYISIGGTAKIHTKDKFADFETILKEIFLKYFEDEKERKKVLKFVLNEVKTRVLVEIDPEWVKAIKVPKNTS
jgi:hypothetical protein